MFTVLQMEHRKHIMGATGVSGTNDVFVLQLTKNGKPTWLGRISSALVEESITQGSIINVSATSEGCYVNTYLGGTGTVNIYNGPNASVIGISAEVLDSWASAALIKYNTSGQAQWLVRYNNNFTTASINRSVGVSIGKSGLYFLTQTNFAGGGGANPNTIQEITEQL
jgi:hypothetical protein